MENLEYIILVLLPISIFIILFLVVASTKRILTLILIDRKVAKMKQSIASKRTDEVRGRVTAQQMKSIKARNNQIGNIKGIDDREEGQVTLYDPEEKDTSLSKQDDIKVVGVVQPKGFWSKLIMSQKMGYILARLGFKGNGFWVNLINAQQASMGKDQSKGRGR